MAKILQQIAVNNGIGLGELEDNQLAPHYREGNYHSVMIEFTDPSLGKDYLIQLDGVKEIREQERPSLFQEGDDAKQQKHARNDKEFERLQNRVRQLEGEVTDKRKQLLEAQTELEDAQEALENERSKKVIASVEVWTYNAQGQMADHYQLDAEDSGELIPIGNVVVSLNQEAL